MTTGVDGTAHHSQYAYETNSDLVAQIQHHRGGALKLTESRTWDAQVDRLERIMSTKQSGPIVSSHDYHYDRSHRRVRAESEDGAYWKYGYNDRDEVVDASKSLPVSGPVGNDVAFDFNAETPVIYSQHMSGSYTIEDGGATLKLNGNTWRAVAINNFTVTAQTILEFYFKSGEIGEVPGIGFDTDTNHDGTFHQRFFQLSVDPEMPTPQIYGIQDFHTYETDDGWKFYRIPVGAYLNGSTYSHLVFSGDDDTPIPTGSVAKASFKHVRLYDRTDIPGWDYRYSYDNIGNRLSVGGDSGDESFDYDYLLPGSTAPTVNQPASIGSGPSYMVKGRTSSTGLLTVDVDGFSPNLDTVVDGDIKYFAGTVLPVKPDQNTITIADSQVNRQYFKFVSPTSYTPGYDEDGNLTEDDRWEYEWDANNRLKKMSTRNAVLPFTTDVTYDFKYDYLGRRIEVKETVGQNAPMVHTFLYDGWNLIARLEGGNLDQSYVWGSDLSGSGQGAGGVGGLLMIYDKGTSRMHLPCYDGNGNVMATVRADTQSVSAEYGYDPFGQTHRLTGNFAAANPFRFSTKYTDTTSGHIYYGLRYYDPRHGRWLSRDPVGEEGGLNLYGFVGNDGVNQVDVLGLDLLRKSNISDLTIGSGLLYSCYCGWIDGSHLQFGNQTIKDIWDRGILEHEQGIDSVVEVSHFKSLNVRLPIIGKIQLSDHGFNGKYELTYKPGSLSRVSKKTVAMNIWMHFSKEFEAAQSHANFVGLTGWSVEDLPSNYLGGLIGLGEYTLDEIKETCDVLSEEESREMFDSATKRPRYNFTHKPKLWEIEQSPKKLDPEKKRQADSLFNLFKIRDKPVNYRIKSSFRDYWWNDPDHPGPGMTLIP